MDDSIRYQLLKLLDENPGISQRELAEAMGVSLGKANYCLRGLIEVGQVKIHNFRNSRNKGAYLYKLTPSGLREKMDATRRFLARRQREYEAIRQEIEDLQTELSLQADQ